MRRNALCLSVSLFLTLATSGCATFNKMIGRKTPAPAPSALGSADLYVPAMAVESGNSEFRIHNSEFETQMPRVVAADPTTGVAMQPRADTGSRMHIVARKETLYSLARQYYGDHHRWKDIFEANRPSLRDPNKIFVGQRLAIP